MPRYLVERSFPDGLEIPSGSEGRAVAETVIGKNDAAGVTWVRSFVTVDHRKTFCIYDGATPEAIREAAGASELPIDSIVQVDVLDPYFYSGGAQ